MSKCVKIADKLIGDNYPCFVIAEIGINHNGSVELAKKMIDIAVTTGCDAVKFQKRTVDANILIFERTKEELKAGRTLFTAINSGFDRAFTSIFDSNMTTIITCAILYFCGTSIVKGFALTLAIGVAVSMFSAITITKNFMHLIFGTGNLKNPALFGLKPEEIGEGFNPVETKREKAKFGILD